MCVCVCVCVCVNYPNLVERLNLYPSTNTLTHAVQQSTYYGLSSMLPPRYSQALLAGESVAGFVVALNRIFTKLIFNSERIGAIVFFVASLLFVLLCVGCYVYIRKSRFVKYHTLRCHKRTKDSMEQEMEVVGELPSPGENKEEEEESNGEVIDQTDRLLTPTQHTTLRTKVAGEFDQWNIVAGFT